MKNLKKDELMNLVALNLDKAVKEDKSLGERMLYTIQHEKKATKRDVLGLLEEAKNLLGGKFITHVFAEEPPKKSTKQGAKNEPKTKAEASLKPKKSIKKKAEKTEEKVEEEKPKKTKKTVKKETAKEEPKKATKKTATKKKEVKKEPEEVEIIYPKTLKVNEEAYKLVEEMDIKKLHKMLESGKEIVLAWYWKSMRSYPTLLGRPKEGFPDKLDLCTPVYVSDEGTIAYFISLYTECFYEVLPRKEGVELPPVQERPCAFYVKK